VELIVKVDLARASNPAEYVATVLERVAPAATAEEVFPGLRTGASAGLVTVRCPGAAAAAQRACIAALEGDAAIAYVSEPKRRRPL
jgi:hypothetical protein